ncbi:hypothetical protein [Streptomyces sp. NPDC059957]|uniref:hypothetical protein n=1 Tax=unclassified Streptomyces TaxID=2593676 RepID=UPI00364F4204
MNHLDVVRLLGLAAPGRPEGEGYGQFVPEDFELLLTALPKGVIAASVKLTRCELPVRSRRTTDDGVLLWDTTAPDTADWTTVLADADFQIWFELPFTTSEFIAQEIAGRAEGTPVFETGAEYMTGSWHRLAEDKRATARALADRDIGALDEVLVKVRSLGIPGIRQYARELVDRARDGSPAALPEDYLAIMREFPGGIIAGARVFPVAEVAWPAEDRPFLQWGEVEGRAIGWLTTKSDPEDWRIAYAAPGGSSLTHLEEQTFATLLRRRLHGNNSLF